MRNAVFYVALTDAQAIPRREATVVENCNTCHEDLSAHGGSRNDPEYCVLCHTAGRDTITRQPAPAVATLATTTNLRMSYMIHRIHTGEEGKRPYIAYSPSASIDFGEVRFPGDRRNCAHCHVPGQYELPLASGLLASRWSDIDSTRTRVEDYYQGATVITPNHHEAEAVTHMRIHSADEARTAALRVRERTGCGSVLITRGEHGMWLLAPEGETALPAEAREVSDVTGAGDTVIAALALGLAAGGSLAESARLANRAAGIVVGRFGPATVTADELRRPG